ncbi:MAG: nucleotide-binding protein [Bacteroidetes bacterium]|nr:nucleotide-binding protein [Bacteroidota bacterium]
MVSNAFENVFKSLQEFNNNKTFVKVQFLFPYIYSDFVYTLIEAENSGNFHSFKDSPFDLNFSKLRNMDMADIYSSLIHIAQKNSLEHIQSFIEKYELNFEKNVNTIQVRFTPIGLNICTFRINNTFFTDPILATRKDINRNKLSITYPLNCFTKEVVNLHGEYIVNKYDFEKVKECTDGLEGNFEYLWHHPSTLYCKDATEYDGQDGLLSKIRRPNELHLDQKVLRLNDAWKKNQEDIHHHHLISKFNPASWKGRIRYWLKDHLRDININRGDNEVIFISCCWVKVTSSHYSPSKEAISIKNWLLEDFNRSVKVILLDVNPGMFISEELYEKLNSATLGIFLLTSEIKVIDHDNEIEYSRPNIYHEVGYLMARLKSWNNGGILPLVSNMVNTGSNLMDQSKRTLNLEILESNYIHVLDWLNRTAVFLSKEEIILAVKKHIVRVDLNPHIETEYKEKLKLLLGEIIK